MLKNTKQSDLADEKVTLPLTFTLGEGNDTGQPEAQDLVAVWRHLSHQVKRSPDDLRLHVQRIYAAINGELGKKIEGSLLDLHLALGQSGIVLRQRLLNDAKPHISPITYDIFSGWDASADESVSLWLTGSVLAKGEVDGQHRLTEKQKPSSAFPESALSQANRCLEQGRSDLAQQLLEVEILSGRHTSEIEQALLALYQRPTGAPRIQAMIDAMAFYGVAPSTEWQAFCQSQVSKSGS